MLPGAGAPTHRAEFHAFGGAPGAGAPTHLVFLRHFGRVPRAGAPTHFAEFHAFGGGRQEPEDPPFSLFCGIVAGRPLPGECARH